MRASCSALLLAVGLTGCAAQTFWFDGRGPQPLPAAPDYQRTLMLYAGGIGQRSVSRAAQVCGGASEVYAVRVRTSLGQVLVALATLGVLVPRTASVYCKLRLPG